MDYGAVSGAVYSVRTSVPPMTTLAKNESLVEDDLDLAYDEAGAKRESSNRLDEVVVASFATPILREDLSRTAFFLTDLYIDNEGVVILMGKMPGVLSSYRLALFGYNSRLTDCAATADIKNYRQLVVETLQLRFLMQGDQTYLIESIRNLTEEPFRGILRLILHDALAADSMTIPLADDALELALTVSASDVTPYVIALPAPPDLSALRVQVYFVSDSFSDGEEYLVPA